MSPVAGTTWRWMRNGDENFPAMLEDINAARESIALEAYIFTPSELGRRFREHLVRAASRGVKVRVLVDAIGSVELPGDFWSPLRGVGGEVRVFNPLALKRFGIRNHRKLLLCDDQSAFIGGFNLAPEYEGDGVTRGWRDLGLRLEGSLVRQLALSFDEMFALAEFRHKRPVRLWSAHQRKVVGNADERLLLCGPGRGRSPIRRELGADLRRAKNVQIMSAYFLPTWRITKALARAARHGGRVQLILPGKSDVALAQAAGRSVYRRLLKAGVEISEYQPQVLHAKLYVVDDAVYLGSANLDPRSLSINYELMVRFANPRMVEEARAVFASALEHSRRITLDELRRSETIWSRLKQRFAYFLLARIDPHVARYQWRALPE